LPSNPDGREEKKTTKPIIIISASYDSYSISPVFYNYSLSFYKDLSFGVNTNGSGFMALLELIKLFRKLFDAYGNLAKYDLIFVLTPTGSLNYKGTEIFLQEIAEKYKHEVAFALSLDSIGNNEKLYLHISRMPKQSEQTSNNIFEALNITAAQMNIPFSLIRKPINKTEQYVPWEHEQFACN